MSGLELALTLVSLAGAGAIPVLTALVHRHRRYRTRPERDQTWTYFHDAFEALEETVAMVEARRMDVERDPKVRKAMRELERCAKSMVKARERLGRVEGVAWGEEKEAWVSRGERKKRRRREEEEMWVVPYARRTARGGYYEVY